MLERDHSPQPWNGFVPCVMKEYPTAEVMAEDGCVETGPDVLGCMRLLNGNIGLILVDTEADRPQAVSEIEPDSAEDQL